MINYNQIFDDVRREWDNSLRNLQKINIIMAGISGAGKSTLLNQYFGVNELSRTGIGDSVTQIISPYTIKNNLINIWDTHGIEMNEDDVAKLKDDIFKVVEKGAQSKDVNKFISCIWYCINSNTSRMFDNEVKFIKDLINNDRTKHIPIIIIITQCYFPARVIQMKEYIKGKKLKGVKIVDVLALEEGDIKPYGLNVLNDIMQDSIPETIKKTLVYNQVVSLKSKRKYAIAAVAGVSLAVFAINYSKLLVMYNKALFPAEVSSLISLISMIYGIEITQSLVACFVSFIFELGANALKDLFIRKCIPYMKCFVSSNSSLLVGSTGLLFIFFIEKIFEMKMNNQPIDFNNCRRVLQSLLEQKNVDKQLQMLELNNE